MKKIFTLSALLLSFLAVSAQDCMKTSVDHSRVIVGGSAKPSKAVYCGLFNARFDLGQNEIALIAGQPCTQAYYIVYDEEYRFIACGTASMIKEGEVKIVKVDRPADKCRVVLSVTPFIAQN